MINFSESKYCCAKRESSDQPALMRRLIRAYSFRTCNYDLFIISRLTEALISAPVECKLKNQFLFTLNNINNGTILFTLLLMQDTVQWKSSLYSFILHCYTKL